MSQGYKVEERPLFLRFPRSESPAKNRDSWCVYEKKGDLENALVQHQKALEIRTCVFGSDHPHVAMSYNNIGLVYNTQGKYEEALDMYSKSLDINTRIYGGDNHPDVATSKYNIANLKETQGDLEGARRLFLECQGFWRRS